MKIIFLAVAASLIVTSPALGQTGSVTYPISNSVDGATSVTVNYSTQRITWHYSSGFDYTEARTSSERFNERATIIQQTYGRYDREEDTPMGS